MNWISPLSALALAALALSPTRADESADLAKVAAAASQNADPATAAQVEQFTKDNQGTITTILRNYRAYLDQISALADGNEALTGKNRARPASASNATDNSSSLLRLDHLLKTSSLEGAHLDGYPALPDVPPTSSILFPTAAQLAHKAEIDKATRQRQLFYMRSSGR